MRNNSYQHYCGSCEMPFEDIYPTSYFCPHCCNPNFDFQNHWTSELIEEHEVEIKTREESNAGGNKHSSNK